MKIKRIYYFTNEDAKKFKIWCVKHDSNQKKVANDLGIGHAYLNYIINGRRPIPSELLPKLMKYMED